MNTTDMYDFIGDIHGHATKLKDLLKKLGYTQKNNSWSHPERKAFFVGDYIDRGPEIRETLEIVRGMVDSGNAIALMGNHEYNALCFHYPETEGGHLRKHLIKNIIQHYQTLLQFQNQQKEYESWLDWFKTLPLFYETESLRAVHACWDNASMQYLKGILPDGKLSDDLIYQSAMKGSELYEAIDITLKGKEIRLPEGISFNDKDGTTRSKIRTKWWEDPKASTYKTISVEPIPHLPDIPVDNFTNTGFYSPKDKPVFFGHYWLKGNPMLQTKNVCCLDYSVAKGGHLAAYRFDGERMLEDAKIVYV